MESKSDDVCSDLQKVSYAFYSRIAATIPLIPIPPSSMLVCKLYFDTLQSVFSLILSHSILPLLCHWFLCSI